MKLLFLTDTHIRGAAPRSRKDDFFESIKIKLKEIGKIIKNENIDIVLHGGDWFDRPDISPSVVRETALIIREYSKPIYTIAGNHDLYGQNPDTLNRTMLGLLEGSGLVKIITEGEKVIIGKSGIKLQLSGSSYSYETDSESYRKHYVVKKDKTVNYAIHAVHGMLLERPFFEGVRYTLIDNILDTEADITFAGHYHTGFGIIKIGSKYFANPGSLVRVSVSKGELARIPGVILVDMNNEINLSILPLKTARKGEDVLEKSFMLAETDRDLILKNLFNNINNVDMSSGIDLDGIIERIAASDEIADDIKAEALKRLTQASEMASDGSDETG